MCVTNSYHLEDVLRDFPLYSQDGKGKEAVCCAIFFIGNVRWFILEGNRDSRDTTLFGIVIGLMEDEYGYFSLNEMQQIKLDLTNKGMGVLRVEQVVNFKPTALKLIPDLGLQDFLRKRGYLMIQSQVIQGLGFAC